MNRRKPKSNNWVLNWQLFYINLRIKPSKLLQILDLFDYEKMNGNMILTKNTVKRLCLSTNILLLP